MAFSTHDTIVAIATPPGRGGIGVVRVSGPEARAIAAELTTHPGELEPRHATFTHLCIPANENASAGLRVAVSGSNPAGHASLIDQAVVTFFPAPRSYTGEDVVELSAHGSPVVLRTIVEAAVAAGARLAEPGEFTLRAFLNGRIDLTQAEAVADLIDAVTPLQARAAFDQLEGTLTREIRELDEALFDLIARLEASVDFPDEGYHFIAAGEAAEAIATLCDRTASLLVDTRRGRLIREGLQVTIAGAPNVGKSSVFNALAGASRAIVADVAGTTRDLVTETIDLDGFRVTLVDTAGLRDSTDAIEAEGVSRSMHAQRVSDLVLFVTDDACGAVQPQVASLGNGAKYFVVQNKIDLTDRRRDDAAAHVSARTGEGLNDLRNRMIEALAFGNGDAGATTRDRPAITNVRHAALVERAYDAFRDARAAASQAMPEELLLADLQRARSALEEVTGRRNAEDLLRHIFARFCIGK